MTEGLSMRFAEGGYAMYPLALLGCLLPLVGFVLLVVTIFKGRHALTFASIMAFGSFAIIVTALAGKWNALALVEASARSANPDDRAIVMMVGSGEAMVTTAFGYGVVIVPTLLACALLGIGLSRLERFKKG